MTNQDSPLKLNSCKLWPPTIDVGLSIVAGGANLIVYKSNEIKNPAIRDAIAYTGIMYTAIILLSGLAGYAEYAYCKGYLPLIQDTVEEPKKPDNWLGRQKE